MKLNFIFFIVITFNILSSQEISYDSIDKMISLKESYISKKKKVDSVLKLTYLNDKEKSYLYHTYARCLNKKGEYEKSIIALKKAIKIRELDIDNLNLKKSLFNLGLYYRKKGDYSSSIKAFQKLIELAGDNRLKNKAYTELLILYESLGDYQKSILYFKKSNSYFVEKGEYKNICKNLIRISRVYSKLEDNNNRLKYLVEADSLSKNTHIDFRDQYVINLNLANAYQKIEKKELALFYYERALKISKERKDSNAIALLYNNIGYLYVQDSLYNKGYDYLEKGLVYAENNARRKASLNLNIADYYLKLSQFEKALISYNKALNYLIFQKEQVKDELSLKAIENSPNRLKALNYLTQRGNFWFKRYQVDPQTNYLEKALADFKLADQLTDVISLNTGEQLSKLFWREKGADLYIKAIAVCNELQLADWAYYFMEKNKALLLLEHVNDERAKLVSKLPEQLVAKDFSYRQQITQAGNNPDLLFDLKSAYSRFKDSLATAYPNYARLRKQLPVLSLQEHQLQFISNQEATLQFIVNTDKAFGLVITNNSTDLYPIKNVANLTRDLIGLREKLQNPFITQEEVLNYSKQAYAIFNEVLPAEVYQKIKGKKLTIATDGNLQNIPFEALVTQAQNSIKNIPYFISTNQIDYVYSFSYLNSNNQVLRAPEKTFLGLAPKKFQDHSLSILTNSVKEVNTINTIFNDQVYIETKATKSQFLADFNHYNIVHLATHSGLNKQTNPWLAFYDAKVSLDEIYATKNQADLVILSACKTSQGTLKSGEGVMSLARGFFFSGTNTVVSSLWNLNDKTTEKIMVNFYEKLNNGSSKSEALHQAKLDYIKNNSGSEASPFYWSSFILIGDGTGILESPSSSYIYPIIGVVLLLLFIVIIYFFKKVKRPRVTK